MGSNGEITTSSAINEAVRKATADGIIVEEITTGWEKAREVVSMKKPLSSSLRAALNGDPRLRHWSSERTPHNRADEGYTDDQAKVAISFPMAPQP